MSIPRMDIDNLLSIKNAKFDIFLKFLQFYYNFEVTFAARYYIIKKVKGKSCIIRV